ncbi:MULTISPECIES: N-acetylglucosamine-6-phosphate deacetylase [unclassified Marinitoga]|uniref:N-acetylglucosamine-6-phosphate deacetylase n=1 Tax=unclassified Marinitoga TaxID=2640159 RepID=UPI00064102C2|nr:MULTISPECIES: N-acetylglucosamine-6-phosphate deacetylase [unclassified Marinitoga]KLO23019.1 N-acetylglucosamine-6-phosphate deacetylase [Marinitoga sp. 1155]NUV00042.1 N-acetylglucosamine-6-phosphate deacetylase [Marinitoga sp. 1154]
MIIDNILIVDPIDGEYTGKIILSDNKIKKVLKEKKEYEYILMPGFVDTHTHGYKGIDTMNSSISDIRKWAELNFSHGITKFFPTTVSASIETLKRITNKFSPVLSAAGIHLEGPFINKTKKGAQNEKFIHSPEIDIIDNIISEKVKLITMAPESKNFFLIADYLKNKSIIISLGHSNADYITFKKAILHGINRITHFPNALKTIHHREIGGVGAGLLENFKIELIVDNIHTSEEFIKLIYKIKNIDDIILITDSISATNLKDGIYSLGELKVTVKNKRATLDNGTIAGSTLTFDEGVRNFYSITNCSLKELSKVSSYNALQNLNIKNEGRIKDGYIANFVIMDKNLNVIKTIFNGDIVYRKI